MGTTGVTAWLIGLACILTKDKLAGVEVGVHP